ncbi:hypothetical protein F0562_012073 [Nyssa sinensis]|uniref:Uncharacterized protein n=1 Tax=Nyssa sinensis TaxID=561372 RepID=A0A5J4ZRN2_9ASTE|nr:hypothetical protein F0562_012073 [Nyssa sinensis]
MFGESLARNEEGGNVDSDVDPIDIPASWNGVPSSDPSHFDPPLPQIKDDGDLSPSGILVRIPSKSRGYNSDYSPDKEGFPRVPSKRRIFGADGRMRGVMIMVHLEEAPLSLTVSIVDHFSSFIPPLIGVTRKRATQGSDDSKGKKI